MNWLQGLLLGAVWCIVTRAASVLDVTAGLLIGQAVAWAFRGLAPRRAPPPVRDWPRRLLAITSLTLFFLWEMLVSNLRIAWIVLRPGVRVRAAIVEVPVEVGSERELAVLSDLITLTPGTLTVDACEDGTRLLVHVISEDDPELVRDEIRTGLAPRVRRVFS